jgi:hypothetical protein
MPVSFCESFTILLKFVKQNKLLKIVKTNCLLEHKSYISVRFVVKIQNLETLGVLCFIEHP